MSDSVRSRHPPRLRLRDSNRSNPVDATGFSPYPIGLCSNFGTSEQVKAAGTVTYLFDALAHLKPLQRLVDANADDGLRVSSVTKLNVRTADGYGSVGNSPFLRAQVDVTDFESSFYLQTLAGESAPTRLQYVQRQTLAFNEQQDCKTNDQGKLLGAVYYDRLSWKLDHSLLSYYWNATAGKREPPSAACLATQPKTLEELAAQCKAEQRLERWPHIEVNTLTKRAEALPCTGTNLFASV